MRVSYKNLKSAVEEYDDLKRKWRDRPDFIPFAVHPNQIRASDIYEERLKKKMQKVLDSAEYKFDTS